MKKFLDRSQDDIAHPVQDKELQTILDVLKQQWPIAEIKLRAAILELQELRAKHSTSIVALGLWLAQQ